MHDYGVTALVLRSWHRSAEVTRPSQLILAHASDHNPHADFGLPYFSMSLQVAASPCWKMALPDVISAILVWALGSLPRHGSPVLWSVPFPDHFGLILSVRDSARENNPANSFTQGDLSRLQPFVYLQAPILARPSGCSDLQFPFGHRALYTAQYLLRCRQQAAASLRVRIRTIDTTGLRPDFTAPHLLDRSLVGRSYTPISCSSAYTAP